MSRADALNGRRRTLARFDRVVWQSTAMSASHGRLSFQGACASRPLSSSLARLLIFSLYSACNSGHFSGAYALTKGWASMRQKAVPW